jgi:hypothetical protein
LYRQLVEIRFKSIAKERSPFCGGEPTVLRRRNIKSTAVGGVVLEFVGLSIEMHVMDALLSRHGVAIMDKICWRLKMVAGETGLFFRGCAVERSEKYSRTLEQ